MPTPFLPSPIAHGPGSGAIDQDPGPLVVGPDKAPNIRNPLYKTTAEGEVAPFIRRCMEKQLPDRRDYAVMAGGQTAYTSDEARRKLCPTTPDDFPPLPGVSEQLDKETFGRRVVSPPRSSARLEFPADQDFKGHSRPVSTKTRR